MASASTTAKSDRGKTSGGKKYRDWRFDDGYTYRQFVDGDVLIVASPKGGAGTLITRGSNPKAWTAITDAIAAQKSGNRRAAIEAAAQVAAALIATLTPQQRRAKVMDEMPPETPPAAPPPFEFPWLPAGIAVGLVALIAVLRR